MLLLLEPTGSARQEKVEFPFDAETGTIWLPVKVNGTGPYHFLLDTGIRGAISRRLVDLLDIPVERGRLPKDGRLRSIGLGRDDVNRSVIFARAERFEIGPFEIERPWNLVLELSHLPEHADGLIGYNVLKDLVTVIDYPRGRLSLFRESFRLDRGPALHFRTAGFVMPGGYVRHLIFVDVRLNGKKALPFLLDTGAGISVLSTKHLEDAGVTRHQIYRDPTLRGAGLSGEITDLYRVTVDSVSFADFIFRDVELNSFDLSGIQVGDGLEIAGLLGFDLLRSFVVCIDFRKREIAFGQN